MKNKQAFIKKSLQMQSVSLFLKIINVDLGF